MLKMEFRVFPVLVGAVVIGYGAGEQLRFSHPSPSQVLSIPTTASTSSASVVHFSTTTFAKIDPPPPILPPGDRQ